MASSSTGLHAHHVQLAVVSCEGGHGVSGQGAGRQGVVGVHSGAVLVASVMRDGRVEAGPEHPQVKGTCREGREEKNLGFRATYSFQPLVRRILH